ncbi:MAG TPA: S41 family peptidase [Geobacterales bacterium]|nr:S41 family peptidase [Geobacterales bacterium]
MNRLRNLSIFVAIALVTSATVLVTIVWLVPDHGQQRDQQDIRPLKGVMQLIKNRYVEEVDDRTLLYGAINGMLATLDPHSSFLPADSFTEMRITTKGAFGGLGIEITIRDGKLTIISPIEDTPAHRAGLKPGDLILRINDESSRNMTINEAVSRMRGQEGTKVRLTILRNGQNRPFELTLVRATIRLKSVRYRQLANGFGYLRISQFQERTSEDFIAALESLKQQNKGELRGLVIDLRNNPGGLLDQAIQISNRFIGQDVNDSLIVSTRGRGTGSEIPFYATIGDKEPPYPIVVLINGGSASASEIVAGALQDHRRALILGTQSFGKGSVQTMYPLRDGAGLLLTTARYYTPSGRSIQATGITPDLVVPQLELSSATKKSREEFHEKDLQNHLPPTGEIKPVEKPVMRPQTIPGDTTDDYQLSRALELLKGLNLLRKRQQSPAS